jgi:hypothetical protein
MHSGTVVHSPPSHGTLPSASAMSVMTTTSAVKVLVAGTASSSFAPSSTVTSAASLRGLCGIVGDGDTRRSGAGIFAKHRNDLRRATGRTGRNGEVSAAIDTRSVQRMQAWRCKSHRPPRRDLQDVPPVDCRVVGRSTGREHDPDSCLGAIAPTASMILTRRSINRDRTAACCHIFGRRVHSGHSSHAGCRKSERRGGGFCSLSAMDPASRHVTCRQMVRQ